MLMPTAGLDRVGVMGSIRGLTDDFARDRSERQRRRWLDPDDFEAIRRAGFHLACLPTEEGGLWENHATSTRFICDLLRVLASADSSVALVCAMHPAVLSTVRWLDRSAAPEPYTEAWQAQRAWAFETVREGRAWWGTIQSEPGTGGDLRKTKAIARRISTGEYRLTGDKHFGSGAGMASYMITTALPDGEPAPDVFFMDMRGVELDGSAGVRLLAEWDGHGMPATQSHALRFEDFCARRLAWPSTSRVNGPPAGPGAYLAAVCVGIVEMAVKTAREYLERRRTSMRPFEQVEWSRAEMEGWLVQQAFDGLLRAIEAETDVLRTARFAKLSIAELAESTLGRICRVVGGGSYSRESPFGNWFEDVRALGFLRPPWGLAFESLFDLTASVVTRAPSPGR